MLGRFQDRSDERWNFLGKWKLGACQSLLGFDGMCDKTGGLKMKRGVSGEYHEKKLYESDRLHNIKERFDISDICSRLIIKIHKFTYKMLKSC